MKLSKVSKKNEVSKKIKTLLKALKIKSVKKIKMPKKNLHVPPRVAPRVPAFETSQSQIDIVHREWCRENGYPAHWYRAKHGRPKLNKGASKRSSAQYPYLLNIS